MKVSSDHWISNLKSNKLVILNNTQIWQPRTRNVYYQSPGSMRNQSFMTSLNLREKLITFLYLTLTWKTITLMKLIKPLSWSMKKYSSKKNMQRTSRNWIKLWLMELARLEEIKKRSNLTFMINLLMRKLTHLTIFK